MEVSRQSEMRENYRCLSEEVNFYKWQLYVFGHTDATGYLIAMVRESGHEIAGILDNNKAKQGTFFEDVPIMAPQEICQGDSRSVMVFITSRAYAAMLLQLKELGFRGRVVKLVDYNTFAEYDLSFEVLDRRLERERRGEAIFARLQKECGPRFLVICPFKAVGDVYYAMKYLEAFQQKRGLGQIAVAVVGNACAEVVKLFHDLPVFSFEQKDMDELVQAMLFRQVEDVLVVHHDRPYSNYLIRLLRKCFISFEMMYKSGMYGLNEDAPGKRPRFWQRESWEEIPKGKSVVLMPYAKSVVSLPMVSWENIARVLKDRGYDVFSSIQGAEKAISGTEALTDVPLCAMKSVVEQAGCFIALRNGLCDLLQEAECRKVALYPAAYYSDTSWQVVQFFRLPGCDNVIFKNDGSWELYDGGGNRPFDFAKDLDF